MSTQSRRVYYTPDQELNRILQDIANRLDYIEGLRPDLDAGYYLLDDGKIVETTSNQATAELFLSLMRDSLDALYYAIKTGIAIADNLITLTATDIAMTAGSLSITKTGSTNGDFQITDENGTVIHSME